MRIFLILLICSNSLLAVPIPYGQPMLDTIEQINEISATSEYIIQLGSFINHIAKTTDINSQISDLKQIITTSQSIKNLCNTQCSNADKAKMNDYLNQLNNSIIGQFKNYANITDSNIQNMQELTTYLNTSPKENTKTIGLSLQRASQETLSQMQSTLTQMQTMMILNSQKQQVEFKIERDKNDAIFRGFAKSGL
ncbi:MAG: hypothetical protein K2P99_06575 [Burkholderiales bacterium]|nr:hypothetical protein [Burkholderiales bacterium]